jgi:chromosome segregation ATPase
VKAKWTGGFLMNEDKILHLLEKVYTEFSNKFDEFAKRFDTIEERITGVEKKISGVEGKITGIEEKMKVVEEEVKKLGIKIDTEITDKVRALFDDRQLLHEKIDEIDEKIDMLQLDVNNLTVKTLYHDNRIKELSKKLGV